MRVWQKLGSMLKLFNVFIIFSISSVFVYGNEKDISGWPLLQGVNKESFINRLGNDPVLGRMICPPLTRLNLLKRKSEPLILRSIAEIKLGKYWVWELRLRSGIYWWSGKELKNSELADFLRNNIKDILEKKWGGAVPPYKIDEGKRGINIRWEQKPIFGPYILNGVSFVRDSNNKNFNFMKKECVGRYIPNKDKYIRLRYNPKYGYNKPGFNFYSRSIKAKGIRFLMPGDFKIPQNFSHGSNGLQCANVIDLPLVSAIKWNTHKKDSLNILDRKSIAQLFPRRTFVKFGLGNLGSVTRSFIPTMHPFYKVTLEGSNKVKKTESENPLLILTSSSKDFGLLEKLVVDVLRVSGFRVHFDAKINNGEEDGTISGFLLPWPGLDYFDWFHSKGKQNILPKKLKSGDLDKKLEEYRLSLTHKYPNFDKLLEIQDSLLKYEFITFIVQHKACLEGISSKRKISSILDPDWFIKSL